MRPLTLDKVASVTRTCALGRHVHVTSTLGSRPGDVVAVRILNSKAQYDKLELVSGRMSTLVPGDVIAGALGHRAALMGYAGHCPESLQVGDQIQVLNLGGVLGICDAASPAVGAPFQCEVLGQVLSYPVVGERVGVPANIARDARPLDADLLPPGIPVIAVAGTCMNSGKTAACVAMVKALTRRGLRVAAAKATGVSLRRDVLAMEDAGARDTLTFTDFGVVTTTAEDAPAVARSQITALAATRPDVILVELGDGLLGAYGVDAILGDRGIRDCLGAVVLAAADPVGAWGGVQWLRDRHGIEVAAVTGPATDNPVGIDAITARCGVAAINARQDAVGLAGRVWANATEVSHVA